jgi:hypothetical protein
MKLQVIDPPIGFRAKKIKPRTYAVWDLKGDLSVHEYSKPFKEQDIRNDLNAKYETDLFKNQKLYEKCVKELVDHPIMQFLGKFFESRK